MNSFMYPVYSVYSYENTKKYLMDSQGVPPCLSLLKTESIQFVPLTYLKNYA